MSTLNVDTINDRVGTGQPAISGLAKAWVNFNGTGTVAIRASYNVSSITDNGTGNYTVNFTTALSDANYALAGSGNTAAAFTNAVVTRTFTTSGAQFVTSNGNAALDLDIINVAIFR